MGPNNPVTVRLWEIDLTDVPHMAPDVTSLLFSTNLNCRLIYTLYSLPMTSESALAVISSLSYPVACID